MRKVYCEFQVYRQLSRAQSHPPCTTASPQRHYCVDRPLPTHAVTGPRPATTPPSLRLLPALPHLFAVYEGADPRPRRGDRESPGAQTRPHLPSMEKTGRSTDAEAHGSRASPPFALKRHGRTDGVCTSQGHDIILYFIGGENHLLTPDHSCKRVSYSGSTSAFQAEDTGSIPVTRSSIRFAHAGAAPLASSRFEPYPRPFPLNRERELC